jgi:hypothetical protein
VSSRDWVENRSPLKGALSDAPEATGKQIEGPQENPVPARTNQIAPDQPEHARRCLSNPALRELRGAAAARKGVVALAPADNEEDRLYDARYHNLGAATRDALALVGFVAACLGAAFVGSAFTAPLYRNCAKACPSPSSHLRAGCSDRPGRCCTW